MSGREWLFALFTVALSSTLTLAAIEGFVRFEKRHVAFQPDPDLIRSLRPRISYTRSGCWIHYEWFFPNEPYHPVQMPEQIKAEFDRFGCPVNGIAPYSRFIHAFLEENGIRYRDPYEALLAAKASAPTRKLWFFYDYHFSPAGHQLMGRELAELLEALM